jgi:hypothetical protein
MTLEEFVKQPLRGQTSLSKVFWLYGVLGSLLFSSFELFLNPENQFVMKVYAILGLIFSVYVTVGIYRCADNSRSRWMARSARVGAIITLCLLPVLTYLDLTGALSVADLLGGPVPE